MNNNYSNNLMLMIHYCQKRKININSNFRNQSIKTTTITNIIIINIINIIRKNKIFNSFNKKDFVRTTIMEINFNNNNNCLIYMIILNKIQILQLKEIASITTLNKDKISNSSSNKIIIISNNNKIAFISISLKAVQRVMRVYLNTKRFFFGKTIIHL